MSGVENSLFVTKAGHSAITLAFAMQHMSCVRELVIAEASLQDISEVGWASVQQRNCLLVNACFSYRY